MLVFASIFAGYIFSDIFVGFGFSFLGDSLFFFTYDLSFTDMELLSPLMKNMPLLFSVLGCFCSFSFFLIAHKFLLHRSILQFLR
jgi:hypothetical protein